MSLFRRTAQQAPERILRAINRPRRDSAEAFLHAWTDTQQVPLAAFPMHYLLPPGAIINWKRSRLPSPTVRGGMATTVGATGSKVRVARHPPRTKKSGRLVSTLFGECLADLH